MLLSVGLIVFLYATYTNNGSMNFTLKMASDDVNLSASPLAAALNASQTISVKEKKLQDAIHDSGSNGKIEPDL